ncbi:MAG: phosphoribosyl-AMP cyclohydrolase [Pseudomonadota bacterium]
MKLKFLTVAAAPILLIACGNNTNAGTAPAAVTPAASSAASTVTMAEKISQQDVVDAQTTWGNGIVAISQVHSEGGDYEARATQHINNLYAYGETDVMFKPTLAAEDQFRETFDEALSYFIGREGTEDGGFAISGWTNVRWESNGIYTDDNSAMAMGNYYFTGPDGNETKVEYTFGYVLDDAGDLKINLHHSSVPYSPQ